MSAQSHNKFTQLSTKHVPLSSLLTEPLQNRTPHFESRRPVNHLFVSSSKCSSRRRDASHISATLWQHSSAHSRFFQAKHKQQRRWTVYFQFFFTFCWEINSVREPRLTARFSRSLRDLWLLRPCYTGQLATPTCNADSQRMFLTRICRHVTLLNCFQKLATRCSTANIAKNRSQRAVTLEWFFAQHRIIASWRCKLTSVTPPLTCFFWPFAIKARTRG